MRVTLFAVMAAVAGPVLGASTAAAQGLRLELGTGTVVPTGPTADRVGTGVEFRVGLTQRTDQRRLAFGVNAAYAVFSNHKQMSPNGGLGLAHVFATAQYRLASGPVRPYVVAGVGIVQERRTMYGRSVGGSLNGGATGALGVEADLGRVNASLEAGYFGVSTLEYENALVRYVPVTLRLHF